jgi:hypothetical protein
MDRQSRYELIGKPSAISEAWLAFEEDRLPYQALNRQIWQQEAAIRGTEWWRARESLLSFPQPVPRNWNVDSDPNVPTEFKRKWRDLSQAKKNNTLEAIAIGQYLKLAEEQYHLGKRPVSRNELWDRVCELYAKIHKSGRPTHPLRILKNVGLRSLKGPPRGRPRKKVP